MCSDGQNPHAVKGAALSATISGALKKSWGDLHEFSSRRGVLLLGLKPLSMSHAEGMEIFHNLPSSWL